MYFEYKKKSLFKKTKNKNKTVAQFVMCTIGCYTTVVDWSKQVNFSHFFNEQHFSLLKIENFPETKSIPTIAMII